MIFLFNSLLLWHGRPGKNLRHLSALVYILHPMCIVIVRGISDLSNLPILVNNSIVFFISVTIFTIMAAILLTTYHQNRKTTRNNGRQGCTDRAWAEINLDNLCLNAEVLQRLLPEQCRIMAVVKANAYGHGDVEVSRALSRIGINAFAVATIDEGIRLRQNGIQGEILILGYTDPQRAAELSRYRLSQTVINVRYASAFSGVGKPIHVHIKVDTGMHRLGESFENAQKIAEVFHNKRFKVNGIFTHLCASDSMEPRDVNLTKLQIGRFFSLLDELKKQHIAIPKIHILSSYGALNCSRTQSDYARLGLALYGAIRENQISVGLKPVLSLKARVVLVRKVATGESIGYGCQHIVERNTRIAVLPIGYADGLPRSLGGGNGCVLLHGRRAPILGSICMDQLMADVTDIPDVECGDVATFIGRDGKEEILAQDIASGTNTITNEILSRLSNRLDRVYILP